MSDEVDELIGAVKDLLAPCEDYSYPKLRRALANFESTAERRRLEENLIRFAIHWDATDGNNVHILAGAVHALIAEKTK